MDHYVVRNDGRRSYYGDKPTAPTGDLIIAGVGAVFRNKMKAYSYVIAESTNNTIRNVRITKFVADIDMRHVAEKMELGFNPDTYSGKGWDPKDIDQHPVLSKMRNLEILNIHMKEVIDIISIGLGETPKVHIPGLSDLRAGRIANYQQMNNAQLTYTNFSIEIQLNKTQL